MPAADRGEVWQVDLGMAAKVRPCLVLGVPSDPADRALVGVVPHTTSLHGTRFEVAVPKQVLKAGAFDAQGVASVPRVKLIRRIGVLTPDESTTVEAAIRLGL